MIANFKQFLRTESHAMMIPADNHHELLTLLTAIDLYGENVQIVDDSSGLVDGEAEPSGAMEMDCEAGEEVEDNKCAI